MKAATLRVALDAVGQAISIHAAREGGDKPALQYAAVALAISIHAAREGGDVIRSKNCFYIKISIHAAREGGDRNNLPR